MALAVQHPPAAVADIQPAGEEQVMEGPLHRVEGRGVEARTRSTAPSHSQPADAGIPAVAEGHVDHAPLAADHSHLEVGREVGIHSVAPRSQFVAVDRAVARHGQPIAADSLLAADNLLVVEAHRQAVARLVAPFSSFYNKRRRSVHHKTQYVCVIDHQLTYGGCCIPDPAFITLP